MTEMFPLFKNNDNIEEGISDKFISILSQCNNPHIICFYGDARLGKSTKMNQIINGTNLTDYYSFESPFKTNSSINETQTKGCDFYGPIKVKDLIDRNEIDINELELELLDKNILNDELFFVDTEGLKSIYAADRINITGILSILQITSVNILYTPFLEKEKFEEVIAKCKISNIFKLFDNRNETIILMRDIVLNDEISSFNQIFEELEYQKEIIVDRFNILWNELNMKKPEIELLPYYELAKNNVDDYSEVYKMQMKCLISKILLKIKKNNNINGRKLIEIIKELIEIFKNIDDIETIEKSDNSFNSILKCSFEQKVRKCCLEIKDKIKQCDKNIITLENKNEDFKIYLLNYIKNYLKDIWNIYKNSINNDIDDIIEKYQLKLNIDLLNKKKKIQEKINSELISILNISNNKEINDYFSKFTLCKEINQTNIKKLIDNILYKFFEKYKKEFDCFPEEYKTNIENYLKKYFEENLIYKMNSMIERENYLIKIIENIKFKIFSLFINDLLKSSKEEIEKYLNDEFLQNKIQLFISSENIIELNKEDFQKKLNELYQNIKIKLKERIDSIKKGESIENFSEDQLKKRTIQNGIYFIKPINYQNKAVYIDYYGLTIKDIKDDNEQKFEIKYDTINECYTIKSIATNNYLTCDKSKIYLSNEENNDINQQWYIINSGSYGYEIISKKNKKLFYNEDNITNDGSNVSCEERKGIPNQIFYFEETNKTIVPYIKFFPKPNFHGIYCERNSIVDALKSVGYPSYKGYRFKIGIINNIPGTPFTPSYNIRMLNLMKQGRLIIPEI